MRTIKNYFKAFVSLIILTISVIFLSTCGGGGERGSSGGGTVKETVAAEVIASSTDINPIAVATNKNASETMVVAGKRNSNGNISSVEGTSYILSENNYLTLILNKATGIPDYFIDSNGNKYVFQNFTTDSATLSIYGPQGRLAWGPSTIKLDASILSEIKNEWNIINSQLKDSSYLSTPETLSNNPWVEGLQIASLSYSGIMCASSVVAAVLTGPAAALLTPTVLYSCGSLAFSTWATVVDNGPGQYLDMPLTAIDCLHSVTTLDPFGVIGCGVSMAPIVVASQISSPSLTISPTTVRTTGPTTVPTTSSTTVTATGPTTVISTTTVKPGPTSVTSTTTTIFGITTTTPVTPYISSVSPNPVTGSNSQQPFTIYGSNFMSGANVTLRDLSTGETFPNRVASSFSSTQIVLNPNFTTAAHSWSVEVINPNGQSSGQFSFTVAAVPAIPVTPTNLSPGSSSSPGPTLGSSTVTVSWNTSSGATLYIGDIRDIAAGTSVMTIYTSSTSATATLSPGKQYRWFVYACNSTGCSSSSALYYFQTPAAAPSTPSVSSISPTSMTANGVSQNLVIYGSNFASSNVVQFLWGQGSGANVWTNSRSTPVVNSSNQITVSMNPGTVTDRIYVRVCSSNGSSSCSAGAQYVSVW